MLRRINFGFLFALLLAGMIAGTKAASAQTPLEYPTGDGYCYTCINLSEHVQVCQNGESGQGKACHIWQDPPGEWWCNWYGGACEAELAATPLSLTPAGTVVAKAVFNRSDGRVVSKCGGYLVARAPGFLRASVHVAMPLQPGLDIGYGIPRGSLIVL
jgi:hypothetical protein